MNNYDPSPIELERGAASAEYALLVVFIAAIIVTLITTLGIDTEELFSRITF